MKGITLRRCITLALCAGALMALAPRPANAGGWQVTYTYNGYFACGGYTNGGPWNLSPSSNGGLCGDLPSMGCGGADGTITPSLQWIHDDPANPSADPPPSTVTFVVTCTVSVEGNGTEVLVSSASDSYGDPAEHLESGGALCTGSHVKTVEVPSGLSPTITLRPVRLTCEGHLKVDGTYPLVYVSLGLSVSLPDLTVHAYSTDRPVGNETGLKPAFFSGTGCWADGSVADFADGVSYSSIDVNGEILVDKRYNKPYPTSDFKAGYFQSNHWPDTTPLKVTYTVVDKHGTAHAASVTANAYNKALNLGNKGDFFFGTLSYGQKVVDIVANYLSKMNHTVTSSSESTTGVQYDVAHILSAIPDATVFSIATHGHPNYFKDCIHGDDDLGTSCTFGGDILEAIKTKYSWEVIPDSFPIRNRGVRTQKPPYNLVFLNACYTQATHEDPDDYTPSDLMAKNFGIFTPLEWNQVSKFTAFGPAPEDRAMLGWTVPITIPFMPTWTNQFMQGLKDGENLTGAYLLAQGVGEPMTDWILGLHPDLPQDAPPVIYGDLRMTLNNVYTGFWKMPSWRQPWEGYTP